MEIKCTFKYVAAVIKVTNKTEVDKSDMHVATWTMCTMHYLVSL